MPRTPKNTHKSTEPSAPDSAERLVLAAHQLLGRTGLGGFRVLDVATLAGANVALINYHFGGRDGLLDEVVRRVVDRIASARTARLDALLSGGGDKAPDVRQVLHCWLDPWLENVERDDDREVMLLMLHILFAADVPQERKERLVERTVGVTSRFVTVLCHCYPQVSRQQMTWRMLCAVGASYLVLGQRQPVGWGKLATATTKPPRADRRQAFEELSEFIVGGLSAPAASKLEVAGGAIPRRAPSARNVKGDRGKPASGKVAIELTRRK